jgi:hypothetical protein
VTGLENSLMPAEIPCFDIKPGGKQLKVEEKYEDRRNSLLNSLLAGKAALPRNIDAFAV